MARKTFGKRQSTKSISDFNRTVNASVATSETLNSTEEVKTSGSFPGIDIPIDWDIVKNTAKTSASVAPKDGVLDYVEAVSDVVGSVFDGVLNNSSSDGSDNEGSCDGGD